MVQAVFRLTAAAAIGFALAGCASAPDFTQLPREPGRNEVLATRHAPLQCVPYARDHSRIKIHGDAYTWWDKAAGQYERQAAPATGAVMVLHDYAGPQHAHVAVVRRIVSPREIRIDHANWLDDGSIYIDDPVVDVSSDNDWSAVKVWNIKAGGWGVRTYPVQGFIAPGGDAARVARNEAPSDESQAPPTR